MTYANIEKRALKIILGNDYWTGDYTLKDELDKYGEDIIYCQYKINNNRFEFFRAWSKTYTFSLVNDLMGDVILLGLERNLPKEYTENNNESHEKKVRRDAGTIRKACEKCKRCK